MDEKTHPQFWIAVGSHPGKQKHIKESQQYMYVVRSMEREAASGEWRADSGTYYVIFSGKMAPCWREGQLSSPTKMSFLLIFAGFIFLAASGDFWDPSKCPRLFQKMAAIAGLIDISIFIMNICFPWTENGSARNSFETFLTIQVDSHGFQKNFELMHENSKNLRNKKLGNPVEFPVQCNMQ